MRERPADFDQASLRDESGALRHNHGAGLKLHAIRMPAVIARRRKRFGSVGKKSNTFNRNREENVRRAAALDEINTPFRLDAARQDWAIFGGIWVAMLVNARTGILRGIERIRRPFDNLNLKKFTHGYFFFGTIFSPFSFAISDFIPSASNPANCAGWRRITRSVASISPTSSKPSGGPLRS